MVAEAAENFCQQSAVSVQYLHHHRQLRVEKDFFDASLFSSTLATAPPSTADAALSIEISRPETAVSCSTSVATSTVIDTSRNTKFLPSIRSGSHTDIGPRRSNEDEHIRIDDLSPHLGSTYRPLPSAFYAVFDGHGGADAATFVKNNTMRFLFEDANLPQTFDNDETFLEELESSHRRAFLLVDQALADECSIDACCGTTALTALVFGRHLLIANAGDCRAVLCRKGAAVQMSQDHRPTSLLEKQRVESSGGFIEYGYLNGELAVTRALGDWYMKRPIGSESALIAEPEVQQISLTEDDEFLLIGCDGIWDVMTNQEAVAIVRRELRMHNDPKRSARELVNQALRRDTSDNLTAIVVCFTDPDHKETAVHSQRPRLRCLSLSEEARNKLRSLLEGN